MGPEATASFVWQNPSPTFHWPHTQLWSQVTIPVWWQLGMAGFHREPPCVGSCGHGVGRSEEVTASMKRAELSSWTAQGETPSRTPVCEEYNPFWPAIAPGSGYAFAVRRAPVHACPLTDFVRLTCSAAQVALSRISFTSTSAEMSSPVALVPLGHNAHVLFSFLHWHVRFQGHLDVSDRFVLRLIASMASSAYHCCSRCFLVSAG